MPFQRVQGSMNAICRSAFVRVFLFRGIPDHWRLKARKGRDRMNVFKETKNILGEVNAKELGVAFAEFMELARSIREKLGCRKYLLDWYLLTLLEMANTFSLPDLAENGVEASGKLRVLIRQAMQAEKPKQPTKIGDTVNAYVQGHPLAFMEEETRLAVYMVDLASLYLEHTAERYIEGKEHIVRCRYDTIYINQLFESIVSMSGSEMEIVRLNELVLRRFMKVKPLDVYLQGYTVDLIYNLIHRDMQTDHTVLQILLDRVEESGDAVSV